MGWLYLLVAGLFEVGFTATLKLSEGFTRPWPSLAFLACSALSFWFLTLSIQTIPLGTAYAVWTGIGAVGTAVVGIAFYKDPVTFWRLFFLAILVAAVVGLRATSADGPG
jgi:quaternary ammonium compound-resistance protein SugE